MVPLLPPPRSICFSCVERRSAFLAQCGCSSCLCSFFSGHLHFSKRVQMSLIQPFISTRLEPSQPASRHDPDSLCVLHLKALFDDQRDLVQQLQARLQSPQDFIKTSVVHPTQIEVHHVPQPGTPSMDFPTPVLLFACLILNDKHKIMTIYRVSLPQCED